MSLIKKMALAAAMLLATHASFAQDPGKTLRIVPQADLKILDPIWTTAFVTRNHGYMIYDTLFGVDADGKIQPQMIDHYTVSADGKSWNFTLRRGLVFSDGKPVTSEDVIASVRRWAQRDNLGQKMLLALDKFEPVGANGFRMSFNQPFGMLLEALAKPSTNPPFIMPARVAQTPADRQIDDTTGSGPYVFKKDEYRPGEKVVYLKNRTYVPRSEAPSGTAGAKLVYVDRVEWVILKDAQTQTNALINGEVDMIEWAPAEQYAALKANPKVSLQSQLPKGSVALHLNHLIPPFNNPKIAQAAFMAINQEALMKAQLVNKDLYNTCTSIYPCGSTYASDKTAYFTGKSQFAEARKLLKEAGYDGTPVVLMWPTDFAQLNKYPPVLAALLQQAGFKVDLQSMDWPTLVSRRAMKSPVAQGGWNAFITAWGIADTMNPLFFASLTGSGEKGWFGWATDARLEQLKSEFLATMDEGQRKQLAEQIQEQNFAGSIVGPIGEYKPLTAYRKGVVSGLVSAPVNVFWNLKKD
ncbi:ABC transporter substrate-binding protein [Herbaspirillum sp. alder98]|uniref:ABC transporter substrate-binding protein n=1 Tax=Herbaspirillum sp. alder98 TaxID=2913096 RepID=UPI001CD88A5D|nr:ABC transporter substrate-binding protein [Herbaspirillum sp. alder98]MCA1325098.1 ABC transporter substrate-binding protein [Herbaspirillum sp. alder98]